jgi:hypothetical protein
MRNALARCSRRHCSPIRPLRPTALLARFQCDQFVGITQSGHASQWNRPCSFTPGSRGRVMSIDRPSIGLWLWLCRGFNIGLIRHSTRQALGQLLLGRRHLDGRWLDRRLTGIQDDPLWPRARGSDPDGRPFDDLWPIRKARRGLRQGPAGYQEKNNKRASDNHKISGYGHGR